MRRGRTDLFSFYGRVGKPRYLAAQIVLFILMTIVFETAVPLAMNAQDREHLLPKGIHLSEAWSWVALVVAVLLVFVIGLSSLSFQVRRFHDFNLTGWLIFLFVPLSFIPIPPMPNLLPSIALLIWNAILVVVPGTRGPNVFGRDPRDPDSAVAGVFAGTPIMPTERSEPRME